MRRFKWMLRQGHWCGLETPILHRSSRFSLPSIPVFPLSHQVLFIDSEIAEEETEGRTVVKAWGQSSAGLLPEEETHYPISLNFLSFLFSLFLSFVKSSSAPL
ncbi:hypothetical protein ABVT39_014030 [Epinephelus coioides]